MEEPLIISNTTPIINFAQIDCLDLLTSLFGALVMPPAVQKELTAKAMLFPKAAAAIHLRMFSVVSPTDPLLVNELATRVHPGEAECLALAIERPGTLLLLDDLAARDLARANRCLFTGTLGCLVEAKKRGLVPALRPLLEELRTHARFWLADTLVERVLRDADE